jgi:NADPH:quinone reductase
LRAWVCHELAADRSGLRFETDWPEPPEPGAGEVRVAMTATALNYPDLLMLSGGYQFRPDLPFIPGVEGCGVIDEVGEGLSGDLIGQRVIVGARQGLLAERVTVSARQVRPVPAGLHDEEAAAHTVGALTAYVALVQRGRLRPSERVLVLGAGGGMGLAAVGVAKAMGAVVTAVAASEAKLEAARGQGATETVLVDRADPAAALVACKGRFDVVFDPLGGAFVPAGLAALDWNGRYLVTGFVAGQPAPFATNRALLKGIEIIGVRAGENARRDPAAGREADAAIDRLAEAGMRPVVGMRVPLAAADEVLAAMAAGVLVGKGVVTFQSFADEARRQSLAVANAPGAADDQAFIDSVSIWP